CGWAVPDIRLYDWRDVAWQRSCRRFSGANDVAVHGADGFSYQSSCRVRSLRYQIGSAQADTRRGLTLLGHDARMMPGSSCFIPRRPRRSLRICGLIDRNLRLTNDGRAALLQCKFFSPLFTASLNERSRMAVRRQKRRDEAEGSIDITTWTFR